jgi:glycosyltransferase involved in cell wall biosynthesis
MKVLQVASSLHDWGGIERYVLYLHDGLRARGHHVDVTCPPDSPLAERIPGHIPLSLHKKHDRAAASAYRQMLKEQRYDVVHVHFSPDFLAAGLVARLTTRSKVLLTRHVALRWPKPKAAFYGQIFHHIIPVSESVERHLVESGIPARKMTIAKAGCPVLVPKRSREEVRRELGVPQDAFAIGCFGRLVPEKGLQTLFEAAKALPTGTTFEIFGAGPLEEELRAKLSQTHGRVRMHGFRTDVADYMGALDAMVIPSLCEEAFGYAAIEAMSLGKPLLVSRVGGLPEMVVDGESGLTFPRGGYQELARCVALLCEPGCAAAMGHRARELHRRYYTVERMAERMARVYESSLR